MRLLFDFNLLSLRSGLFFGVVEVSTGDGFWDLDEVLTFFPSKDNLFSLALTEALSFSTRCSILCLAEPKAGSENFFAGVLKAAAAVMTGV